MSDAGRLRPLKVKFLYLPAEWVMEGHASPGIAEHVEGAMVSETVEGLREEAMQYADAYGGLSYIYEVRPRYRIQRGKTGGKTRVTRLRQGHS